MNKQIKYGFVFLIFIMGIALGSISSQKQNDNNIEDFETSLEENKFYIGEEKFSNYDVQNNLFIKIAKLLEKIIKKIFSGVLNIIAKGLKLIFGI